GSVLNIPMSALAWLGRQGTWAIAALVFLGIAVPPIDALLKPFVTEAIFVLLCVAFLRADPMALRTYLGGPGIILAAAGWTTIVIPALFGATFLGLGLAERSPDLLLALMLQGQTAGHDGTRRPSLLGVFCRAWPYRHRLRRSWPRASLCAWAYGVATQHGADARSNWGSPA